MVFAVMLDGGARLLGRVLPIGRGWRLASSSSLGFGFIVWVFYYAGTTWSPRPRRCATVVTAQFDRLIAAAPRSA